MSEKIPLKQLDAGMFRDWINSPAFKPAGNPKCCSCPLNRFAIHHGHDVDVGSYLYNHESTHHPLPSVSRRFVRNIDKGDIQTGWADKAACLKALDDALAVKD